MGAEPVSKIEKTERAIDQSDRTSIDAFSRPLIDLNPGKKQQVLSQKFGRSAS
jgi:hypothetical protein